MKWVLSQQSLEHNRWLLQDAQEPAQFTFNHHHNSIRIKGRSNRLFFLEVKGVFQKKVLLRSEYGVVFGETQLVPQKDVFIFMNDQKYNYHWKDDQLCFLDKNGNIISTFAVEHTQLHRIEQLALIFASAWISFANANGKKTEDLLVA
jgi:hypothetical protein